MTQDQAERLGAFVGELKARAEGAPTDIEADFLFSAAHDLEDLLGEIAPEFIWCVVGDNSRLQPQPRCTSPSAPSS